jgi:antitoxin (DNA-binding transcriptional repressor) of toxin-antitoxin stability system
MVRVSVQEIQRDPLAFIQRIEAGEPLLVVRGDMAIAEVQPIAQRARQPRPFGLAAVEFSVPDDFNEPLPEEIVKLFET